jgi:hypothetical protein
MSHPGNTPREAVKQIDYFYRRRWRFSTVFPIIMKNQIIKILTSFNNKL